MYSFNGSYPYPADLGIYTQWWWKAVRVSTDNGPSIGHCSVRSTARALAAAGNPGVYPYMFAHPDYVPIIPGLPIKPAFVAHGMELPFVLNCEWGGLFGTECPFKAADGAALAEAVSGYWYRFAATGDPNGDGALEWPSYTAAADTTMRLDVSPPNGGGVMVQTGLRKEACDFWDANP